jgi:glutathione synthase/RimK-type ligase-like ATP-grasp enzyme
VILLWGLSGDSQLAAVARRLQQLGAPSFLLDQTMAARTSVRPSDADLLDARVLIDGVDVLSLTDVKAAYMRPHDSRQIVERTAPGDPEATRRAADVDMSLLAWADVAPGTILNRPSAMTSNDSKPYQAAIIARHGLRVPDTLITTDPDAVRAFHARHGELIYKSISSIRSIVSRLGSDQLTRLDAIILCPTQFQQYVAGCDVRVHVLGDEIFATEIESEADDYRYASRSGHRVAKRAIPLPDEVADRCRALTRALGLTFAGVDLRRTPAGEWYCFEVNPSPGFSYYEQTPAAIAPAVARALASCSETRAKPRRSLIRRAS